ncbi:MAG: hypothetical protein ACP5LW_05785 [Nitrososphaeria archaeon]
MSYVQIVHRKRPRDLIYIRAAPEDPATPNQIRARKVFAEIAKEAKGKKMVYLPPAAELVQNKMAGMKFGRTLKVDKWMIILAGAGMSEQIRKEALRKLQGM